MSDAIVTKPKSWVENFIERARGSIEKAPSGSAVSYVKETGTTAGDYAIGGATGALLGAAHAKFGLDTKGGPIDGWLAGIGALASIGLSGHFPRFAEIARKAGAQSVGILSFRKSYQTVKHEPLAGGSGPSVHRVTVPAGKGPGIAGEDPIEKAARGLG
jgi:hypothetical protein